MDHKPILKDKTTIKPLIVFYFAALIFLLLSVISMPLVIRHELSVTRHFIIEEEILETLLIIIVFGISCFALRGFKHALKIYRSAAFQADQEKSRLVTRLEEAYCYLGTVNVEIQEIQTILCGLERYPQSKKEFKIFIKDLAAKAMTIAGSPWIVLRMISRCDGQTIKEFKIARPYQIVPSATLGNREILEDRPVEGLQKIYSSQKNLDVLTVCIFPNKQLTHEKTILISAITNQIEMFVLLYRGGFLNLQPFQPDQQHPISHTSIPRYPPGPAPLS